jgi:subtilisin-like proprotein convertase family protein
MMHIPVFFKQKKVQKTTLLTRELSQTGEGQWTINIQEQFGGTAFEGMNVDEKALSESGVTINSKEDLKAAIDRNFIKRED